MLIGQKELLFKKINFEHRFFIFVKKIIDVASKSNK